MRFSVVHSTAYRYSSPVYLEPHLIRLRPRGDATQRIDAFALDVDPAPAGRSEILDQDGNTITHVWFTGLTDRLTLRTSFQMETFRENPFDFVLSDRDRTLPMQYAEPLRNPLLPYLRAPHDPPVVDFAREVAAAAGWDTLHFLSSLNLTLFNTVDHILRRDGAPQFPAQTLSTRVGSCRDTAVLFAAACRAVGIAARFVSGYERDAALQEQGDLHAWVEVYLEGGGWRGYDPSRGLATAASHIPVAAAADPALAAPVSGTYRGAATSAIDYAISMQAW